MIRHLARLVWNRKRTNFLLIAEIFCAFLVLAAIVTLTVYYVDNWRRPIGYDYENVWHVEVDTKTEFDNVFRPELMQTAEQLVRTLEEFPEVEAVAAAFTAPYSGAGWNDLQRVNGKEHLFWMNAVSDGFQDVMRLEITHGRWFDRRDDGTAEDQAVLINARGAREFFGSPQAAVGKFIPQEAPRPGQVPGPRRRVIGVFTEFRQYGELSDPLNYVLLRHRLDPPAPTQADLQPHDVPRPSRLLLIRTRPGTPASIEERLMRHMQAVAPTWSFEIEPLVEMRERNIRDRLTPLAAAALVGAFLMVMVALGLVGVLWQSVTQRIQEIGLRRAKGATAPRIHRQILGELLLMSSLALAAGTLIVAQLPILEAVSWLQLHVYLIGLIISITAIYSLVLLCGWYPSRMATQIEPAEALHYE